MSPARSRRRGGHTQRRPLSPPDLLLLGSHRPEGDGMTRSTLFLTGARGESSWWESVPASPRLTVHAGRRPGLSAQRRNELWEA